MITIDELKFKLGGLETAVNDLRDALSIEASEKRLAELEHQMTLSLIHISEPTRR